MLDIKGYKKIASLHIESIDKSFLSSLGIDFLTLLYKSIDESNHGVLIAKIQDGDLIGFVAGTTNIKKIYLSLLKRPFLLFWILLPNIIFPSKIWKIIEILVRSKKEQKFYELPKAELLSISVRHDYRRRGVANYLYRNLYTYFKARKVKGFKILVGKKLISAQKFYENMGAIKVGEIDLHSGNFSYIYIHKLTET